MFPAIRLLFGLLTGHVGLVRERTRSRAVHLALLGFFGLTAFVFLMVLVTAALARGIGLLGALGVMTGAWVLGLAIVYGLMRAEQRRLKEMELRQRREERRAMQTALVTAIPTIRRGGLLTAGVAGLALTLMMRRGRDRDEGR
jgi:hypothetical protein